MWESIAYAAGQTSAEAPNPALSFLPLVLMFVIFYFLLIRPQQKNRQQLQKLVENLKKGDRVVTTGGVIGVVTSIQNDYVVIRTGDNEQTKMEILKSAVTGLRSA
jgi:preprotein translocase subunit YajC